MRPFILIVILSLLTPALHAADSAELEEALANPFDDTSGDAFRRQPAEEEAYSPDPLPPKGPSMSDERNPLEKRRASDPNAATVVTDKYRFQLGVGGLGFFYLRNNYNSLFLGSAELSCATSRHFALGLHAAFLRNATATWQLGVSANYFSWEPYAGFWASGEFGTYFPADAVFVRGGIGWRWHAVTVPGSLGLMIGPELGIPVRGTGDPVLQLTARAEIGIDFSLNSVFY